jgi:hypothetical protein
MGSTSPTPTFLSLLVQTFDFFPILIPRHVSFPFAKRHVNSYSTQKKIEAETTMADMVNTADSNCTMQCGQK